MGLATFFKAFERGTYIYSGENTPTVEYDRLCSVLQWGEKKANRHRAELMKIIAQSEKATDAELPLSKFFAKYEFQGYKCNKDAKPTEEFSRLCAARRWGPVLISRAKSEFDGIMAAAGQHKASASQGSGGGDNIGTPKKPKNTKQNQGSTISSPRSHSPIDLSKSPLAEFFTSFNCSKYTYQGHSATVEFNNLTNQLTKDEWRNSNPYESGTYWKSAEHIKLKRQFYETVEAQFDWFVNIQSKRSGLKKHEYVAIFFGLGQTPMDHETAKKLLEQINVNIYDFLDYHYQLFGLEEKITPMTGNTKPNAEPTKPPPSKTPDPISNNAVAILPKMPTKFPSVNLLGIYCKVTGRVYDLEAARENGTLVLLLKHVGEYFFRNARDNFLAKVNKLTYVELSDFNAMMIICIEDFYIENRARCAGWKNDDYEEAVVNLQRYRLLFLRVKGRRKNNQV
ncbi:hypothetical protein DFH27DRAFT_527369 [Peziza echinospora]|nr:hypothetical protein DFH27DRAFT_527369 [Peziza echinospora]